MQINNTNVAGTNQYEVQSMVDPIGQKTSPLPLDVTRIIFQNAKADLHKLALVCKEWRNLADDKVLRKTIRPAKAFGSCEWKEYIGVDAGEELPLPRRVYRDMEKGNYYLTFIPKSVKVMQENKKVDDTSMDIDVVKEVPLDSLEVIGKLVANPTKGNKIGYYANSWNEALQEKRNLEKPHWVLISKEIIGRNRAYEYQQKLAKKENKNILIPGTNISGLMDTAISIFMEYVRSGERNFILDSAKNEHNWICVNELTRGMQIGFGFASSGLHVGNFYAYAGTFVGVALARKSFGIFV